LWGKTKFKQAPKLSIKEDSFISDIGKFLSFFWWGREGRGILSEFVCFHCRTSWGKAGRGPRWRKEKSVLKRVKSSVRVMNLALYKQQGKVKGSKVKTNLKDVLSLLAGRLVPLPKKVGSGRKKERDKTEGKVETAEESRRNGVFNYLQT